MVIGEFFIVYLVLVISSIIIFHLYIVKYFGDDVAVAVMNYNFLSNGFLKRIGSSFVLVFSFIIFYALGESEVFFLFGIYWIICSQFVIAWFVKD